MHIRVECPHGFDYEDDGIYCPLCTRAPMEPPPLLSAEALGITAKHRKAIMREALFKHYRKMTCDSAADVFASEEQIEAWHTRTLSYMTRRANGESVNQIMTNLWGKGDV